MSDFLLPPEIANTRINGVEEVGLSSCPDGLLPYWERLFVRLQKREIAIRCRYALTYITWGDDIPPDHSTMLDLAVMMIIKYKLHGPPGAVEGGNTFDADIVTDTGRDIGPGPRAPEARSRFEAARALMQEDGAVAKALLLSTCTKVDWWLTNHYVAPRNEQGYVDKVLRLVFKIPSYRTPSSELTHAVYRLGCYASNKLVLLKWLPRRAARDIGRRSINDDHVRMVPAPTADILRRMEAAPAGATKLGVVYGALTRCALCVYKYAVPGQYDYVQIATELRAVSRNPCRLAKNKCLMHPSEARSMLADVDAKMERIHTALRTIAKGCRDIRQAVEEKISEMRLLEDPLRGFKEVNVKPDDDGDDIEALQGV